jgi:hypothetical protein
MCCQGLASSIACVDAAAALVSDSCPSAGAGAANLLQSLNSLEGSSGEISSPQPQQSTAVPAKHPVWGTPVGKVLPEASVLQPIHE